MIYKIYFVLDSQERLRLFFLILFGIITMTLELVGISLVIPLIYILLEGNFFEAYPAYNFLNFLFFNSDKSSLISFFLIILLVIYFVKNLFITYFRWFEGNFLHNVRENISQNLFSIFLNKDINFHTKNNSSILITNMRQDLGEFFSGLQASIAILIELIIVLGITTFLIFFEPKAFIVSGLVVIFFTYVFYIATSSKLKILGKQRQYKEILRTQKIIEGFAGIKEIKSFRAEHAISNEYNKLSNSLSKLYSFTYFLGRLPRIYFELIAISGIVILTFTLTQSYDNPLKIFSALGVFVTAIFKLLPSVNTIQSSINTLFYVEKAVQEIYLYYSKKIKKIKENELSIKKNLKLEKITFAYENRNNNILKNLNLQINLGDKISITGDSGSGKSTLVDIIIGLQRPAKGQILIDGNLIKKKESNWLQSVGYVPQDIFLFDDTIEYNITLEKNKVIDKARLDNIVKICQLKNFTEQLPQKLKSLVGEEGIKISGGQKQRIGIARALYKKPEIIVFDEATNALDTNTEQSLIDNLLKNFQNQAMIFITHKKIPIKKFDKKFELKNGKLINYK